MKPHHWRETMFSCLFMLFEFMGFWFLIILFLFDFWDNFWVSLVIFGYKWWFEVISFNWLLEFYLSKHWVFIVFRSTGTFEDLVKNRVSIVICSLNGYKWWFGEHRVSFVICVKNGFIEWFKRFFKQSRVYLRVVWWTSNRCRWAWECVALILVGVDSWTLESYLLFSWVYVFTL
jgi:hypothetical protein